MIFIMFHNKGTTYEQMEKPKKEKKFKQNAYDEIRKLIEENEGNETVKEIKTQKKNNNKENTYKSKLFDQI